METRLSLNGDVSFAKKVNRRLRILPNFFSGSPEKFFTIWQAKPYTMVEYPRLADMYNLIDHSESKQKLEGAIVECGCWNGGYAKIMNDVSDKHGHKRQVWLFDSFEGLPDVRTEDVKSTGKMAVKGTLKAEEEKCKAAFASIEQDRVHIVPGWFNQTFSANIPNIGPITYLHLDADLYESTKYCLEHLYDLVVPGGLIIFDDYTYYQGCKRAVDEFLAAHGASDLLVRSVQDSAYLQKPLQ